jgi:electron transfer flavoprotein beta subunit
MQIIVCVKAVPDTATKIKVHSSGARIDPEGVKYVMGPYDARACAKAIELRDALKDGSKVIAVSAGGGDGERDARKRLKDALALGADKGVYIADPDPEFRDALSVAKALAAAIKAQGQFGLVFFGRQAVDDQALAVGPMTASILGIPCVTDVVALEVAGDKAMVTRAAEGRTEKLEVKLPCAISAQRDLAEERYAKLKDILASGKKPIETFAFTWPAPAWEVKKLTPPPARTAGKIVGEGPDAVPKLLDLLQKEAKALTL